MQVPGFLLRRLYVKGSLRNVAGGFQFRIKNSLGSGYAEALLPLVVDGREVPLTDATFTFDGETVPFAAVSGERPFTLAMDRETTITVRGEPLAPGRHRIEMGFVVVGLGQMQFDVSDDLAG